MGSTPFSLEELDLIKKDDPDIKLNFLVERAREMVLFMNRFIEFNNVPKTSVDGSGGGVALAGWSLGNLLASSVVGLAKYLPNELVEGLEPYLRSLILYGALGEAISPLYSLFL